MGPSWGQILVGWRPAVGHLPHGKFGLGNMWACDQAEPQSQRVFKKMTMKRRKIKMIG